MSPTSVQEFASQLNELPKLCLVVCRAAEDEDANDPGRPGAVHGGLLAACVRQQGKRTRLHELLPKASVGKLW